MEISHSLRLRQQPKLVMTPQLQQVIKLLQLPMTDLVDLVHEELQVNPMLEEAVEESVPESPEDAGKNQMPEENMDAWLALAAEEGPRESRDRDREAELEQLQDSRLVAVESLQDHLLAQLPLLEADGRVLKLAEFLIGNLDGNGYLLTSLDELAELAACGKDELEVALSLVQSLDPPGVGARNLKECLLLQLQDSSEAGRAAREESEDCRLKRAEAMGLARRIVSEHLEDLEDIQQKGMEEIARDLGVKQEEAEHALRMIRACDPKPGTRFTEAPPAVIPEARIDKVGEDYIVVLNDSGLPPLKLSKSYREMLANRGQLGEEERRYLKERFRSAIMLMRGIEQRRVTLAKTLDQIASAQRDFLEHGPGRLRPLTLKEVADAIGVHESTVSRVVANKYVDTPRGVFPLKKFFSNRIPSSSSGGMSATAVKERIRDLIDAESAAAPLSDDQVAERLREDGIAIARRTVTKYREALGIASAWQRRSRSRKQAK